MILAGQFVGNLLHHRFHRLVGHAAVELSIGAMLETASGRVGGRRGGADNRQGTRVDVRGVAAAVSDDHRMIGNRGVEIGARQGTRRLAVIVEKALYPLTLRRRGCAGAQRRENLVDRGLVAGNLLQLVEASGPRMGVRVVEAREDTAACKIHTPRVPAGHRQNLPVGSDGQNSAVADRDRRGLGTARAHGIHQTVVQDEIGIGAGKTHQRQRRERLDHVAASSAHGVSSGFGQLSDATSFYGYAGRL